MQVTLDLDPEQLAALDLAFDGIAPEEALETSWQMVSEWLLRGKKQALVDLASPSVTTSAIANIDDRLEYLYSSPDGCPCFPE